MALIITRMTPLIPLMTSLIPLMTLLIQLMTSLIPILTLLIPLMAMLIPRMPLLIPRMILLILLMTLRIPLMIFSGATTSLKWLASCAKAIGKEGGEHVQWTSPIGLPVVQPYSKPSTRTRTTIIGTLSLVDGDDPAAGTDVGRHVMALPPNYVHSVDASHMLMTAAACREAGLVFCAVHDSFWTHASDVPQMNRILRDEFVTLHSRPLLEELHQSFTERYSCKLGHDVAACEHGRGKPTANGMSTRCSLPGCCRVHWDSPALDVPPRGELDLEQVRDSEYFFA